MNRLRHLKSALVGGASVAMLASPASAKVFNIPTGDLSTALDAYAQQAGVQIAYLDTAVRGRRTHGASGDYSELAALTQVLNGTGFTYARDPSGVVTIVPQPVAQETVRVAQVTRTAPAAPPPQQTGLETVVVTAQKKSEDIQTVPIAVTALSQQQLTERQIAGGPDLIKEVPNLTFSKTNFTGYNLQIRGIGTQAISVTTDPAVAVAFNDTPFIRNHFFEQEFYDVASVEVLRGPQGTLYGRNATAGVVDVVSAKPSDQFEAMGSADFGNYSNRRLEGMLNLPIAGDKLDLRVAGEWTKREGYSFNTETGKPIDGRDLWSGRTTIGFKPISDLQTYLVWEHFSEDDDRMRTSKQLCKKDSGPASVDGLNLSTLPEVNTPDPTFDTDFAQTWLSQGCLPTSLYSKDAFETPNGQVIPFVAADEFIFNGFSNSTYPGGYLVRAVDPYANETQSTNLRDIQSLIDPHYRAKNDTLEFNADYAVTPGLTLTSQTSYSKDFLYSTEDYNRFDTTPGIFDPTVTATALPLNERLAISPGGVYCDPQLGCSNRMVGQDVSQENAWQFSQEFRLASHFDGPLNFSVGGNYLHYQTVEDYYVFFNLISLLTQVADGQGPGQYTECITGNNGNPVEIFPIPATPFLVLSNGKPAPFTANFGCGSAVSIAGKIPWTYIDPNPLSSINGQGHNYFRSENPYTLNSWAGFGEVYYDVTPDLKLTGGLRWTDDRKVFTDIPSQTFLLGGGYPVAGIVTQGWNEWTGRTVANWSPQIDFTDQSMFYASYAHGYKGGGANPPGPQVDAISAQSSVTHPATFAPEHIEAFELGTKNTALDGTLTLNGDVFYYNYHGYQISQIVDRTSINLNFNATAEGAELESTWEPAPGLKFNFAGGYENTAVDKNQSAIDLMDRTAGVPGWVVVRPFVAETSNCILPAAAVRQILMANPGPDVFETGLDGACDAAYLNQVHTFTTDPGPDLAAFAAAGFNPATAPNNGEGFAKNLGGNKLPNSPPFTLSAGAQYSMPVVSDWAATLRADFYWQGNSYARIFNDKPYDDIHGYTNLNLALILVDQSGWQVMAYVKNVFNVTAITGAFLNSDDSGLTTNVFLTDPRLIGVRVTKQFGEGDSGALGDAENFLSGLFTDNDNGRPQLWVEFGGGFSDLTTVQDPYLPAFLSTRPQPAFAQLTPQDVERVPSISWDGAARITFQPESWDWKFSAAFAFGRTNKSRNADQITQNPDKPPPYAGFFAYQTIKSQNSEAHSILDFQAGKDVGLGMGSTSTIDLGVRYVHFSAMRDAQIQSQPTNAGGYFGSSYHRHYGHLLARRKTIALGPSLSWEGSTALLDDKDTSEISADWGINGAVLFGRQSVRGHQQSTNAFYVRFYPTGAPNKFSQAIDREKKVTIPNLGGFAGLSWRYRNAKVSFGYRADEFFGAMDGGIATRKSENVGFFGPFASVSIGLGG